MKMVRSGPKSVVHLVVVVHCRSPLVCREKTTSQKVELTHLPFQRLITSPTPLENKHPVHTPKSIQFHKLLLDVLEEFERRLHVVQQQLVHLLRVIPAAQTVVMLARPCCSESSFPNDEWMIAVSCSITGSMSGTARNGRLSSVPTFALSSVLTDASSVFSMRSANVWIDCVSLAARANALDGRRVKPVHHKVLLKVVNALVNRRRDDPAQILVERCFKFHVILVFFVVVRSALSFTKLLFVQERNETSTTHQ